VLALLIVICAAYGLVIGSFLNVVIYRVPRDLSIVRPGSACPTCHAKITWYDNIPVVSWLVLRGHCRGCDEPISPRYILVELAGGAIFAGVAARLGYQWDTLAYLAFFSGLLALSYIDVEHLRLPTRIVYPASVLVIALLVGASAVLDQWHRSVVAALCALAWLTLFGTIHLVSPRALGAGDVRLAPLLGFALGWLSVGAVVVGFFAANLVGSIVGVALVAAHRMQRRQPIPYGVFLAIGAGVAILFTPQILSPWPALRGLLG
jgi:leader peptidase (prepilin peptidase)/N-methyltransferase